MPVGREGAKPMRSADGAGTRGDHGSCPTLVAGLSEEFARYMEHVVSADNPGPENLHQPAEVMTEFFAENPQFVSGMMTATAITALAAGANPILSAWATGFQMGREFESQRSAAEELERMMGK